MIRKLAEIVRQPSRDCIYDVVRSLDLGLCVDVGAAAGDVTKTLCEAGGKHTRVVAFEPFPGNHPHFHATTSKLSNPIRLVPKAVSDEVGSSTFVVPSVVQGTETGWENMEGYSSVGFLRDKTNEVASGLRASLSQVRETRGRSLLGFLRNRPREEAMSVPTTTLDKEFAGETIDFLKIDVQGAEEKVLNGATELLQASRIKIIYLEWSGAPRVVETLQERGYTVFDSLYVAGPQEYVIQPFEEIGFELVGEINLSTGKLAYEMIIRDAGVSPENAIRAVRERGLGWIQTDLIAVASDFQDAFETACDHL
ncbi:MAG: FkbM family methyltransferase [Planctomycetota bacterium]